MCRFWQVPDKRDSEAESSTNDADKQTQNSKKSRCLCLFDFELKWPNLGRRRVNTVVDLEKGAQYHAL